MGGGEGSGSSTARRRNTAVFSWAALCQICCEPMSKIPKPSILRGQPGLSLVELAILLFIAALLIGALLAPTLVHVEQEERSSTNAKLARIEQALYSFAVVKGRLPCPDCPDSRHGTCSTVPANRRGDGSEDRNAAGQCETAEGNLPWATLSVPGRDAWGRRFVYRVSKEFADTTPGTSDCSNANPKVSFSLCSKGTLTVEDGAGVPIATNIPAIIISYGEDGGIMPPVSDAERENADGDNIFVLRTYSTDPKKGFDDLMTWLSAEELNNRMLIAGRLP